MINYFKNIFSAENDLDPSFIRMVRIILAVSTVAMAIIATVLALTVKRETLWLSVGIITALTILSGISLFFSFRNILWPGKMVLPLAILVGIVFLAINANGMHDSAIVGFTAVIIITSLIAGQRTIPLATVSTLIGIWVVAYADMAGINKSALAARTAWDDITVISAIQIIAAASLNSLMGRLNSALEKSRANEHEQVKSNQELRELQANLEKRVLERTQSLELATHVGRAVSQVRALDVMLKDAVEIIRSQFDLYYVQIYLTDLTDTNLILQSGTGDVGAQLVSRGHSLALSLDSINGRAAIEKRSVIVADTNSSFAFRPNPLLPLTQSEMAIPLIVADKVAGVLDLQSTKAGSLNQDILPAFEALAGQLAIAIHNAKLLAEAEQARAEVEKQAGRLTRTNWQEYLDAVHQPEQMGFVFENNQVAPLTEPEQPELASIADKLAAPISVSGEKLGTLVVAMDEQKRSAQSEQLIFAIARQVSQQIENLRLLESANRYRAEVEQVNRLATVEGWKKYVEERSTDNLSYLYDLKEVKPYVSENEQQIEEQAATLPLKVRDETIGKISIAGIDPNDAEAISLANDVAERLSAHIESMRQFEETKRGQVELDQRARQLAAVAEVSTVSSRELDIQKMLESVVFLTQRRFSLYHCHVFLYNKRTDHLTIQACGWKEGDEHEGTHGTASIPLLQEQSLVARAGRTLEVVMVNDVHNEPGWLPNPLLPDTASEVAVPLVIGGQLLGVLDVQSDRKDFFTAEDANIYTTLASQVATALQNAQSFARAQQQAEREAKLNIISQKIQSATTVEAVLQIAARELGHALGAPRTIAQLSLKDKQ